MNKLLSALCAAALLCCISCAEKHPATTGITPIPRQVEWGKGTFHMPAQLTYSAQMPETDKADLQAWMTRSEGSFAPMGFIEGNNAVLELVCTGEGSPESYRMVVGKDKITITAPDAAGIFYGLQSLMQMAGHFKGEIPAVTITDAPRFGYRGFMLDVSRHFRDKEFVKKQLDMMARYKLNRFHWHLTDGAGWRIEIKKYPALTDIAAWRPYEDWDGWQHGGKKYCRRDDPAARGGYYTQDEIREVVDYARSLHITVIPEIEMPGHSEEVLAVYPQLSCSGKPYINSEFCVGNEQTFEFLENVLSEVIELFPSEYIHVGGDEAGKGGWRTCPKCAARMKKEGLKDVDELQSYMIHRIETFLNSKGRSLLGWDEILEGGLAPNATVMSWRGTEGGIAAAKRGNHAIMTPSSHCYLDFCQDDPSREPIAAAAFLTLEKAYSYDPAPDSLGADVVPMILGVQGNLWCEHIAAPEHTEHMIWPRLLAIAEVGWSDPADKNYDDFYLRTLDAVAWMQERGYTPFDQKNAVGTRPESRTPVKNLATGKPVTYNAAYDPKYAAAGDVSMTDGLRGDWHYGDGRWLGWLDKDVELVVDLGQKQPVKRIAADFMQGYFAYIWMPTEVTFSISDDGVDFTEVGTTPNDVAHDYKKDCYKTFEWTGDTLARYVRMTARSNQEPGGWLFSDELIVE